ncbi:MAG TPA: right-handed parallel beta-helix repeat-containing protein [Phycisphaerae bacterium]|nr:right-handed parallel beta-helix repeat-containing protein [Phycisphaerae bacterium]
MLTLLLAGWLGGCGAVASPVAFFAAGDGDAPASGVGAGDSADSIALPATFGAVDQHVYVRTNQASAVALTYLHGDSGPASFEVVGEPSNGKLTGEAPRLVYTPQKDFAGKDRVSFRVRQGEKTSEGTITFQVSEWTPPIGIPVPAFGIFETVANKYGDAFFATHYVDNTHPRATDDGNPNGSKSQPRQTIPSELEAGSVVLVAGGPYNYRIGGTIPIDANGTADKPVIIRSADPANPAHFSEGMTMTGQYLIIENVVFDGGNPLFVKDGPHHMAIRHSEVTNCGGPAIQLASWDGKPIHDIVIYDCKIHHNGDVNADYDQDFHGIGVGSGVSNLWVVDNEMYANSGDGIQINAGNFAAQESTHHIYVGRNDSYGNKQTGMWCKQATDVIFSQNHAHHHVPSNSSPGAGMGCQYDPERIWFLFNEINDCDYGILQASGSGSAGGENSYFIGNMIYNIRDSDGDFNPNTSWSNAGILVVGGLHRSIVNNTIVRVDGGIHAAATYGDYVITNNIVADINRPDGKHIFFEHAEPAAKSSIQNCVFSQEKDRLRLIWGGRQTTSAKLIGGSRDPLTQCVEEDPHFVDIRKHKLQLRDDSPAIDHGAMSAVYEEFEKRYGISILVDFDGVARPIDAAIDVGADEH